MCARALFFATSLAPFDVSFAALPEPPRFVRFLSGYPLPESQLLILQGEAKWGGCLRNGDEPARVWVW
jgi:hypothetical protein